MADPGSPPPPRPPYLFVDQAEALRAENNFFETGPLYLRVWMTVPPVPLIWRSASATETKFKFCLYNLRNYKLSIPAIKHWKTLLLSVSKLNCILHGLQQMLDTQACSAVYRILYYLDAQNSYQCFTSTRTKLVSCWLPQLPFILIVFRN